MNLSKSSAALLIIIIGIVVYSNSFFVPFQLDDNSSIVDNPSIRNIGNLTEIWSFLPRRFLLYFSLALNYHFGHLNVVGYHATNLIIHIGAALFVYLFVCLTFLTPTLKDNAIAKRSKWISLLVGLVFVSHPLQTESVTYIVQRTASMAALFYIGSLCFYIKSRLCEEEGKIGLKVNGYYFLSILLALLSMFSKETAVTLPLMVLLYEVIFFGNKKVFGVRQNMFLLLLLVIPLTIKLTESSVIMEKLTSAGISPVNYFLTQLRVVITYIRLVFLPVNQNIDYDYHVSHSLFEFPTLMSALTLIVIVTISLRLLQQYRLISFAVIWFFLTLLPESSFLPLADVIFEHRLYLPLVGYSILLVCGLYYLCERNNTMTMVKVLIVIIAVYAFLTYQRNEVWKDELTLWSDAASKSPHKARIYSNRGVAYGKKGKFEEAIADLNKAIEIQPNQVKAYSNLGYIYYLQKDLVHSMIYYNKVIALDPHFALAYWYRGVIYEELGDLSASRDDFNKAAELSPMLAEAYHRRGVKKM